jgi:hypothetical protein
MGFTGHLLMENRSGLVMDARLTHASGTAQTKFRGLARVGWMFTLRSAAYTLIRLPRRPARG